MPTGLTFDYEAVGADGVIRTLDGIAHHMGNIGPASGDVFRAVEAGEAEHFRRLDGRYVKTGATMESLTQPHANGAIREAHASVLVFGTNIWYARFLRRRKKSAVLVLNKRTSRAVGESILEHLMRGGR